MTVAKKKNGNNGGIRPVFLLAGSAFLGVIGGAIGFMTRAWFEGVSFDRGSVGDAVAIANTYIVFTTLIVALAAIILTIVGIALSREIGKTKISQARDAFDFLKEKVAKDEIQGIGLIDALLENEEVKRHLHHKIKEEVEKQVDRICGESDKALKEKLGETSSALRRATGARELRSRLAGRRNGSEGEDL